MNPLSIYSYFALTAILLWILSSVWALRNKRLSITLWLSLSGTLVYASFIVWLWIFLSRPPLRSMGEIRLWYSLFLALCGLGVYIATRYSWLPSITTLLSSMFALIGIFKPEMFDRSLMPALRSPWFVPHVTVYILSYSLMSVATITSIYLWMRHKAIHQSNWQFCHRLVHIGWALLTMGMVMGALWAKEAWGDYWSWDPKETWASATWLSYLVYIHLAPHTRSHRLLSLLLIFSFLLLQMCWYGVNYLPSAQMSIHTY